VGVALAGRLGLDDEVSGGWSVDLNYTHNLSERISVELLLSHARHDVERGGASFEVRSTALEAAFQFGWPAGSARLYAGAGAARWLNDVSGLGGTEAENSWAPVVAAGVDLPLHATGTLVIELRHTALSAGLSTDSEVALGGLALRANYVFRY
jgi:outer membrane protein W